MSRRTVIMLTDDLDGGDADETVSFSIDGIFYEIDLSEKNAGKMRGALEKYMGVARRMPKNHVPGQRRGAPPRMPYVPAQAGPARPAVTDKEQNRAIREWAAGKGLVVSDRGRIKQEIVDRYMAEAGVRSS